MYAEHTVKLFETELYPWMWLMFLFSPFFLKKNKGTQIQKSLNCIGEELTNGTQTIF